MSAISPRRRGIVRHLVVASTLASAITTGVGWVQPATAASTRAPGSPTASPSTQPLATGLLRVGSRGPAVRVLQQRLSSLGYWLGRPDGVFADATQQAVYALQKAASLVRDGVVGPHTWSALDHALRPHPRSARGDLVEIDLHSDLLMVVRDGRVVVTLNTSTGGGYRYSDGTSTALAVTPRGLFHIVREVNGLVVAPLGELWRPKYFVGGYAIHGSASVPPVPVSHGCVRVSMEAMNWIWATHRMSVGTRVWIY